MKIENGAVYLISGQTKFTKYPNLNQNLLYRRA